MVFSVFRVISLLFSYFNGVSIFVSMGFYVISGFYLRIFVFYVDLFLSYWGFQAHKLHAFLIGLYYNGSLLRSTLRCNTFGSFDLKNLTLNTLEGQLCASSSSVYLRV